MKRVIKFRGRRLDNGEWVYGFYRQYPIYKPCGTCIDHINHFIDTDGCSEFVDANTVGQYTGLKDKNGNACIFEGDLLSLSGTLIGNQYENEDLLKDRTNLLIEGLCTKEWIGTYQEAIKRGCVDAK